MNISQKKFNSGQKLLIFFALSVAFWIPLYKFFISTLIALWILSVIYKRIFKPEKIESLTVFKKFFLFLQIIFFLLIVIGYFISDNKEMAGRVIVQKLSFFIFPFLFIFSGMLLKDVKNAIIKVYILGNIIASLICVFNSLLSSISFSDGNILFSYINSEGRNIFRYTFFSVFHHPAYFSMYLAFSVTSLYYLKNTTDFFETQKMKILYYTLILFFSLMIFLLSSRAGIAVLFILLAWIVFRYLFKFNRLVFYSGSAVFLIFLIFLLWQNERVNQSYMVVKRALKEGDASDNYPKRLILWKSSIEISSENLLFGNGGGDSKEKITLRAIQNNFSQVDGTEFNAHNQFLEILVSYGLVGLLLFLTLIVAALIYAVKKKDFLMKVFLFIVIFNFLFESMLETIAGIVFFSFFLNYFIYVRHYNDSHIIKM